MIGTGLALAAVVLFAKFPIEINPKRNLPLGGGDKTASFLRQVEVDISLDNLGSQLVKAGAIDKDRFFSLYSGNKVLEGEAGRILSETMTSPLVMTQGNSGLLLNFFWALGLANKNVILETGPMMTYSGGVATPAQSLIRAGNLASTGGWTLANGPAMNHYSRHSLVSLTPEQQRLVEAIAKNIYRPCCNNPAYFPDCNHGMAMLGFLELIAARGASEKEIYQAALRINSFWFPDAYLAVEKFLRDKGVDWNNVNPQRLLGYDFSSVAGYKNILSQTTPPAKNSGGGCGV